MESSLSYGIFLKVVKECKNLENLAIESDMYEVMNPYLNNQIILRSLIIRGSSGSYSINPFYHNANYLTKLSLLCLTIPDDVLILIPIK